MRTPLALLLAAAVTAPALAQSLVPKRSEEDRVRYQECVAFARSDPAKAVDLASKWRGLGGGLPARHCLALGLLAQERYGPAAQALEQAARAAEAERDPSAADLWGQAGNAAMLGGDWATARTYFGSGLTLAAANPPQRAGLLVDRARAAVEAGDLKAARADLDAAVAAQPNEAIGLTLRAALARRQGDLPQAGRDIAAAARLAPGNPDVMFEQANIAAANGDLAGARRGWEAVTKAAPGTPPAELAAKELAASSPQSSR